MARFRATQFGRQRTIWRDTKDEAVQDAIRRGWASRDNYPGARIFYGVGVKIEEAPDAKKGRTP